MRVWLAVVAAGTSLLPGTATAAPPVGGLRWHAPPAAKWSGVRNADRFAPGCLPELGNVG